MPAVANHLFKISGEEVNGSALTNAGGNGGMKIKKKETRKNPPYTNTFVPTATRNSVAMEIGTENIAATTVI